MVKMNNKGISSVIGTIFLVLTVLLVGGSVFVWNLRQSAIYNQAVQEIRQTEADRFSERIATSRANFTVPETGTVQVDLTVSNEGPVSAQIITAWVVWTVEEETKYGFNDTLNINLNPGQSFPLTTTVAISNASSTGAFSGWLVTARGNMVPLEEKEVEEITVADVAAGIGSVSMNFTNFKYYNVTYNATVAAHVLDNYPNGGNGYNVIQPSKGSIAFQVCLTNFDRNGREIKLSSASVLWALLPILTEQPRSAWWYIVDVYDNGTIASTFTERTLLYGVPTWVFFASGNDVNSGGFSLSSISSSKYMGPAAVNLMLVGEIGTSTYGQNVPFVSIYVTAG